MKSYEYRDYGGMGGVEHPMHREFERGERRWWACTWVLTALLAALLCAAQVQ